MLKKPNFIYIVSFENRLNIRRLDIAPALRDMKDHFKNDGFTFQQHGAPSHTSKQNPSLAQRQFPTILEQEFVASFIARSQHNRLQCVVHVGN